MLHLPLFYQFYPIYPDPGLVFQLDSLIIRLYNLFIRGRMTIDPTTFRQTMRFWATGVTIAASCDQGVLHGMTVSSFTSISVDPAVVMISLFNTSRTHLYIQRSGIFGITILDKRQKAISEVFAGKVPEDADRFLGLETFTLETCAPLLKGGLAWFDCKVIHSFPVGQNTVFFGEVAACKYDETGKPLLYSNRAYGYLQL
jgi:flavin reductase (DIM6/NTAB) family NADH-FMN oxidoreductase RutF